MLLAALGLAAGPGAAVPAVDTHRLDRTVEPTFQFVELALDAGKRFYRGAVRIELEVLQPVERFRLHADVMKMDPPHLVSLAGERIPLTGEKGEIGLLTLSAGRPIPAGSYTLEISFTNDFGTRSVGLYRMVQEGQGYLFTQFEADDARKAFPCFDEPSFKIPWQLELTVPEAHIAVTNTPVESERVQDGQRVTLFRRTRPMPSYLVAFAAGPLETFDIPGLSVPGRVVTVKGRRALAATAAQLTPPLLAAMEEYFGGKYPFEKLDLIAVPEYWPGAMENPGAITFSENLLLIDPRSASPAQRRRLASTTAHELAHMWFGDLVTMAWWDDLWLNESFADWMGDKIAHQVHPELRIDLTELQSVQGAMVGDARPSSQAIRRAILAADNKLENVGTDYNKGKAVLGMFERSMGAQAFRRGVLDYLKRHEWGNAEAGDLWNALSKSSGSDVTAAMATFLEQGGMPLIGVEPIGAGKVRLTQRRFLNDGVQAPAQSWKIPVVLRYPDGETVTTRRVWLDQASQVVDLGPAATSLAWVMPDAEAGGYYRWSVPTPMLETLAAGSRQLLSPRERIAFLGNLSALLDAGAVHGDDFLRALERFAGDPEPQVVSSLIASLSKVKQALVPDDQRPAFAAYVRRTLGPALERFGLEARPGEDEGVALFRPQLVTWLGDDGEDPKVREHARALARAYLSDPGSVDPSLVQAALQLSARQGDRALYDEYRKRFESAQTPTDRSRFLSALAAFRDPALVDENLKYSLEGPLRPQEIFAMTGGLADSESGRDRLFRHVTENYAAIAAKLPPQFAGFMPFVASGCEPERVEAARRFFGDPSRQVPGTQTSLAKVADQVEDCVRLRRREAAAVAGFLGGVSPGR